MRLVIKIGSNIIAGGGARHPAKLGARGPAKSGLTGLNERRIRSIASAISSLSGMGHEVVVVSSGAIAAGMKRLGLKERPTDVRLKQAAAASGQSALMWTYEKHFKESGKKVAQVLLTREDLSDRRRYINSKNTLLTLLSYGVIPIINENDTVATDEIKFGDNDHLAALCAGLIEAERLVILSDVDGLYSEDPGKNPDASLIKFVDEITPELKRKAGGAGSEVGTGGMYSKVLAAEKAVKAGITVNIINGKRPGNLLSLIAGRPHGTEFRPPGQLGQTGQHGKRLSARKGWIAFGVRPKGTLTIDEGARKALVERGKSLLPSGVVAVSGDFQPGDAVYCADASGNRVAKGLANYSSSEMVKIAGKKTTEIEQALGYKYSDEVIHRDNLVML